MIGDIKMNKLTKIKTMRLPVVLVDAIQKLAKENDRTFSSQVLVLLKQKVKELKSDRGGK